MRQILTIISVFALLVSNVRAADGSGTNTVSPTSVFQNSTGNTLTFTFTAAESMNSGEISINVPSGWSEPQGTSGTAGFTTASSAGTIAKVQDDGDSTTGWSAGSACANGLSADTITKQGGTASIRCDNGNEANNDNWFKNISSENWSGYTKIAFWIRATDDISDTRLRFAYDNDANLASPIEQISFDQTIQEDTWTYVILNFGNTIRTSIESFGFVIRHSSQLDNEIVWIDDILVGPGLPTFPGGGDILVRLLELGANQTITIKYGDGGGASGAAAPSVAGDSSFLTKSRTASSGALTSIASSPIVSVIATPIPPTPAPPPPIIPPGPGPVSGGVPPTFVSFSGKAFPNATITIVVREPLRTMPIKQEITASPEGDFHVEFVGILQGNPVFSLIFADKDNRITQAKNFILDTISNSVIEKDLLIPPTIGFEKTAVTKGDLLNIVGFAVPESRVEIQIDNKFIEETKSDNEGFYKFSFNTAVLGLGQHSAKSRQIIKTGRRSDFSNHRTFSVNTIAPPEADFNGDGIVNIQDWSIFLARWKSQNAATRELLDLNRDSKVDIKDFSILLQMMRR